MILAVCTEKLRPKYVYSRTTSELSVIYTAAPTHAPGHLLYI